MDGRQFFDDYCNSKIQNPEDYIVMPKTSFVKEHKKLLGILKRQNPKELSGERQEQKAELQRYIKKGESNRPRG